MKNHIKIIMFSSLYACCVFRHMHAGCNEEQIRSIKAAAMFDQNIIKKHTGLVLE